MQKNNITNKITPCCGLPFSVIYWWVSNLTLNSEADRQYLLTQISQSGVLSIDGWKVLINSGTLEADASLTKAEFLAWFNCEKQPSCEQLKLIIEGYKLGVWVGDLNEIRFENVLGVLEISDPAPTTVGLYRLSEIGTYTNLGGIVTTAGKINDAYFDGTTWKLSETELPNNVVNNLTSNSTTDSLSSNQGRILNGKIVNIKGFLRNGSYYHKDDGSTYNHPTLASTPLIPISKNSDIRFAFSKSGNAYTNVVFFNENQSFISSLDTANNLILINQIPSNAEYIAVNSDPYVNQIVWENNEVIFGDLNQFNIKNKGKKLVTGGDSLTANLVWQPKLVELTGLTWVSEEVSEGVGFVKADNSYLPSYQGDQTGLTLNTTDGFYYDGAGSKWRKAYKMAIGGTSIKPTNADAISIRLRDAVHYQPDILIIYAGQNDPLDWWKSSTNTGTTYDEIVRLEPAVQVTAPNSSVSSIGAYKGLLEYLANVSPKTKIYLVTQMRVLGRVGMNPTGIYENIYSHPRFATGDAVMEWERNEREPRCEYIKALGRLYGLPVIDLYNQSSITNGNAEYWYPEPSEDCTQVHPTDEGYYRMAEVMENYL